MIAIYARQSVDRIDSISIEQQIELCKYETRGETFKTYIDKGYSGKNTNRPQFTRMMNDIKEGYIHSVIVYKLDRISRSILDFSNMMEVFGKFHVQFVSATEKFDTSSPMGNAMLNICIVFAQLERETIQKRVADAYYSRSQKSFFMGGPIPYGFKKVPTIIDGVHTSMFEQIDEEAAQIRLIYEMYSKPFVSFGNILDEMNKLGLKKRGKHWERPRIRDILINPIYVKADLDVYNFFITHGVDIVNPPTDFIGVNGCYNYKAQNAERKKSTVLEGSHIVLAPHKGIIDSDLWLKCREKCMGQKQIRPIHKAKNTWLAGKIKCGECGYALVAKQFNKRKDRYLLCSHKINAKACKGAGTIYTNEMEKLIYNEMKKKLAQFETLSKSDKNVPNAELTELNIKKTEIDNEINSLLERVQNSNEALFRYINERITELDRQKCEIEERFKEKQQIKEIPSKKINNHLTAWDELTFEDKRQVTDTLIKVIYATSDKVTIQWKL